MNAPLASGHLLSELAARTGSRVAGDDIRVERVGTLEHAQPGSITFVTSARYRTKLHDTRASAVIVSEADADITTLPRLISANPYATYARVAAILHVEPDQASGVHPTAIVDAAARVDASATVGPYCVIGARASIGAGARIGAHCVIGEEASVGECTIVHPRVTIYRRCSIGARGVVHSGVVIGADGFGLAPEQGAWLRIPQIGRVVIGDDVDIGANTTIDRGAIDDTTIGDGVKLDNQIQIGHNCVIGAHTAIAGCVGIAGSTRIGEHCRIGGAAMISGHLTIAAGTTISGGTVVGDDIDAPGLYTGVFPTLRHAQWMRAAAYVRQLGSLRARLRAVERALAVARDGHADQGGEP